MAQTAFFDNIGIFFTNLFTEKNNRENCFFVFACCIYAIHLFVGKT